MTSAASWHELTPVVSRVMVHLFARLTRLLFRVAKSNVVFKLPDTSSVSVDDPLVLEANKLNSDVDAWIENLQLTSMEHDRIQVGNRAYAYAMKVGHHILTPDPRS